LRTNSQVSMTLTSLMVLKVIRYLKGQGEMILSMAVLEATMRPLPVP
jgi:hypothetical protein